MGGLTSAVHWWEESQLRVLVLSSMAIQIFLLVFSSLRRFAIPRWARSIAWMAYLAGDAVAIYALATLFNHHEEDQGGGGGGGRSAAAGMLEVMWVPVLLLPLGGQDSITAYNIEDNELWSRHLLTVVSQVTVAPYVFCKSWPPGGDKRLLQVAILLFIPGVLRCFMKPWALKSASICSLCQLIAYCKTKTRPRHVSALGITTTQKVLQGVSKMASEAGGPVACLGYSWQGNRPSNCLS
ncbi:uncharacterized protein [Miscanthus floridulus]|uniref:uncharacterized protein n=1 Tax=Miscanthus floridulus TaxID=154761 RepID=UPI003459105C